MTKRAVRRWIHEEEEEEGGDDNGDEGFEDEDVV